MLLCLCMSLHGGCMLVGGSVEAWWVMSCHVMSCNACMHPETLTLHIMENKQHATHEGYISWTFIIAWHFEAWCMWLVDEDCALQTLHVAIACFHVTVLAHEFACWWHVVFLVCLHVSWSMLCLQQTCHPCLHRHCMAYIHETFEHAN